MIRTLSQVILHPTAADLQGPQLPVDQNLERGLGQGGNTLLLDPGLGHLGGLYHHPTEDVQEACPIHVHLGVDQGLSPLLIDDLIRDLLHLHAGVWLRGL